MMQRKVGNSSQLSAPQEEGNPKPQPQGKLESAGSPGDNRLAVLAAGKIPFLLSLESSGGGIWSNSDSSFIADQHWKRNLLHCSPHLTMISPGTILGGGLLFETELLEGPENKSGSPGSPY
jgi:hypothetical protein